MLLDDRTAVSVAEGVMYGVDILTGRQVWKAGPRKKLFSQTKDTVAKVVTLQGRRTALVAFMTEALRVEPSHRVLEIGAGSGYQTAVLAELGATIYAVEVIDALAERARGLLEELQYPNAHVRAGDGYAGWPEHAPYDRIIAAAAPDEIPPALIAQLKDEGILAIPLGVFNQELRVIRRAGETLETIGTMPVRFVPMIRKA